jgi:hypothetical protein
VPLGHVHETRREKSGADENDEAAKQSAPLPVKGIEQRAHGWRVARQFEKAHQPEYQEDPQVGGQRERELERQNRKKIDDSERTENKPPARFARAQMPVRRMLGRNPHP